MRIQAPPIAIHYETKLLRSKYVETTKEFRSEYVETTKEFRSKLN